MSFGNPYRPNFAVTPQKLAYTGASARTTAAFNPQTSIVRIIASSDCFVKLGSNDVAVSANDGMFVKANWTPEYLVVGPGQYIAAVSDGADGMLYITEMTR